MDNPKRNRLIHTEVRLIVARGEFSLLGKTEEIKMSVSNNPGTFTQWNTTQ